MDVALRLLARPATADAPNDTENGELTKISTPPSGGKTGGSDLVSCTSVLFRRHFKRGQTCKKQDLTPAPAVYNGARLRR